MDSIEAEEFAALERAADDDDEEISEGWGLEGEIDEDDENEDGSGDEEEEEEEEDDDDPLRVVIHHGAEPLVSSPCAKYLDVINERAVWTLSGAKPGNGVEQLLDDNKETFWQSDGTQPHFIRVQFYKRETILGVAIYMNFPADESYTPKTISFRVGSIMSEMRAIRHVQLERPQGWVWVPFGDPDPDDDAVTRPVRGHVLQISIEAMHQNGRDTHVRAVRLYGPKEDGRGEGGGAGLTAPEFAAFQTLR